MSTDVAIRHATLWRFVPGYHDYLVSTEGDVNSLKRGVDLPLKPSINKDGYASVSLSRQGQARRYRIHRLVLLAFVGPAPDGKPEACHINGDPSDNRLANLRWGSHSDNMRDKQRHGTEHWSNRTHCPQGHPYDAANTYLHPKRGSRLCRTCATTYKRERRRTLGRTA